mmetsp:Transcript_167980/g.297601  ORF Transcript_167980/g.297601 Transcript_167980/m.297601 type:complete len:389 (-) Transcript_167980:95-1261(-)
MALPGASIFFLLHAVTCRSEMMLVNYSGYLIDEYCYSLCNLGGIGLDGSNVITGPYYHTIHCLRDVPQCRQYFLAEDRGSDGNHDYQIKFKLDDDSNKRAVELLEKFPKGGPRDKAEGGFRVTVTGKHNGDGILTDVIIRECTDPSLCDSVCKSILPVGTEVLNGESCQTPELTASPPIGFLLVAHIVCMCLSWGCFLPLGVLWARNLRKAGPGFRSKTPIWFQGHRTFQSIGVFLQLLGFLFILLWKKAAHFKFAHEIIGLIVIILGTLQPVNAVIRNLHCIGHPEPGKPKPPMRIAWEILHKGSGYTAVILGMINVILGPWHAGRIGFPKGLYVTAAIFIGISFGILVIGGAIVEVRRFQGKEIEKFSILTAVKPAESPEPQMIGS